MKPPPLPLLILLLGLACSKNSSGDKDRELPSVTITAPAANQSFAAGAIVNITGNLSDNNKLAEVHVHISDKNTGALLIDIHRFPNAATYSLKESFTAEAGIAYKIQVVARDNYANEDRATVEITTN